MHKRDNEHRPQMTSGDIERALMHFAQSMADMSTPFSLDEVNSAGWQLLGHIPNPFTGKVESLDQINERRKK